MQSGDLIVFDQRIPHGVSSIDPHKKIFLNKLNGRISLAFSIGRFLNEMNYNTSKHNNFNI